MKKHHPTYHWLILICCCLLAGITIGFFNSAYGAFYTPLAEKLHTGRGPIALHTTVALLMTALASPFALAFLKRAGMRASLLTSLILMELSLLLVIPATHVWQLVLLGVLRGVGESFIFVPTLKAVVERWYLDHVGFSLGIIFSAASGIGAGFSWLIALLLRSTSLHATILVCAVIVFLFLLPGLLFMHAAPEEIGLHPHGWRKVQEEKSAAPPDARKRRGIPFWKIPDFYLICAFSFLVVPVMSLQLHFPGFCEDIGAGAYFGGLMMSAAMTGGVVFKLVIGEGLDVLGTFRTQFLALMLDLAALTIIISNRTWTGNGTLLLAGGFLFGVHAAFGSVGIAGISRAVLGEHDDGTAFSIISGCSTVGTAVANTVFGAIYDVSSSYDYAFFAGIALLLTGSVILLVLRARKKIRLARY